MNRSRVTGDLASHGNIFVDIANDRVGIGSTIPGQKLSLPDSAKIALGNSADLTLHHDGSHSVLDNLTGGLFIKGGDTTNGITLQNRNGNESMAKFIPDGAVELYHNNVKKFETSSTGSETTGGLLVDTVDPVVNVGSTYTYKYGYFGDTDKQSLTVRGNESCIEVFASEQSYHAGSILLRGGNEGFGFVNNSSDDRLEFISFTASANSFALHNGGANLSNYDKVFVANKNGSIDLYHSGSKKFETTSSGVKFTGILEAIDNQSILLGTSNDFRIRHTGTNSEITDEGTGKLRLGSNQTEIRSADLSAVQAQFISGGAVNLYHNNNKKLETISSGVEITGTEILLNDDSNITAGTPHTYTYGRGSGATSALSLYGDESALEIVSNDDGTHGGTLLIRTNTDGAGFVYNPTDNALELMMFSTSNNNFAIHNTGSHTDQDKQLRVVKDGAVELNHNGTKKFETTAYGINVTGTTDTDGLVVSGISTFNSDTTTTKLKVNSTNAQIDLTSGQASFTRHGAINHYHNNSTSTIHNQIKLAPRNGGTGRIMFYNLTGGSLTERLRIDGTDGIQAIAHITPMSDNLYSLGGTSTRWSSVTSRSLFLIDTDAGSDAGPEFKLYRNSASPADADYLGQIKFAGESDTGVERNYAKITGKILDASNGTEDGIIEFAHIKAGSQVITGRWRSDSLQLLNGTQLTVAGTTTLNSPVTVDTSTDEKLKLAGSSNPLIRWQEGTTNRAYIQWNASANFLGIYNQEDSSSIRLKDVLDFSTDGINYHAIWHSGNDGVSSGLDADLLDGKHDTSFLRSDAGGASASYNATQDITFSGGAGAIRIAAASDIRFTAGAWTGDSVKIQYHSDKFYWQSGANGWQFRDAVGAATLELTPAGVISGKDLSFSSEIKANHGAGALRIQGGSDIRFTAGNWTGESVKIQYHSDKFYWQTGANGWQFRDSSGVATLELSPAGAISGKALVFSQDCQFTGGASAVSIAGGSDIRFTNGAWTGNSGTTGKIQMHDNVLYIAGGSGGIMFRESDTDRWQIEGSGHFTPEQDSTYDIGTSSVRVRNIYADTLYGDGSNLSNITSTTINNNANNRIITGSGTANTLEAESNLTFDGSTVDLHGGQSSSNNYMVLRIEDTYHRKILFAEATSSHTPGTYGGFIGYDAQNNLTTIGTNHNSNSYNGITITREGGYVLSPTCPKFSAYMANNYSWNNQFIVYDSELYDIGSNYNTSNGKFTAPVTGYYVFGVKFRAGVGFGQFGGMWTRNSSTYKRAFGQNSYAQGDCIVAVDVIPMSANDTMAIRFEGSHGGATGGAHENGFWGYLLG